MRRSTFEDVLQLQPPPPNVRLPVILYGKFHYLLLTSLMFQVLFKNEQECFIGFKTTRRSRVVFDPIKHVLQVF